MSLQTSDQVGNTGCDIDQLGLSPLLVQRDVYSIGDPGPQRVRRAVAGRVKMT